VNLLAYPRTKPSDIEWLGDVPEHWAVKRLRYLSAIQKGRLPSETFSSPTADSDLPYLSMEFLRGETDRPNYVATAPGLVCADAGDLLLLWDGSNAGEFLRAKKGVVSSTVARLETRSVERSFLSYACKALEPQIKDQTVGMGIPHVSGDELKSCSLPYPDRAEQQAIAAFLDRETGRMDQLVAKKWDLIERLKEKRTALISRTVTRGLPAETAAKVGLPANPPLKPSTLDWIGDIPKHWEVKRLSYLATLKSGENITSEMIAEGGDYPVYGGNGLRGNYHKFTHRGHYVLIGRQGALCGNINYASGEFWASEHALVVSPLKKFAVAWMGELLRAMNLGQYSVTAAQPGIAAEIIRGLRIPFPPLPEQIAIAEYLDTETRKLDALLGKVEVAVERLQEYRTALITAAVTGKIDVRKVAA